MTTAAYYSANKAKFAEASRKYYRKNKAKLNALRKLSYKKNRDKERARNHAWWMANKERIAEHRREYRRANREKIYAARRLHRKTNPEQWALQCKRDGMGARERRAALKQIVINHYGKKCNCCGLTDERFLTVDHVNHGRHNVMSYRTTGSTLYRQVIASGYSKDYQILCLNCNCAKGFYGKCPHEQDRELGLDQSVRGGTSDKV
jgi:hypothetical protein